MDKRILILEKHPSNINYKKYFDFKFDKSSLSETRTKRLLKKDITFDFTVLDNYDLVILVGAEPLKVVTKKTSITEYQGILLNNKYVGIVNPAVLSFNPTLEPSFLNTAEKICAIVHGDAKQTPKVECIPVTTTTDLVALIEEILSSTNSESVIAVDTETTGLYPRKGFVLGISITWKDNVGAYIDSSIINEDCEELLRQLFFTRRVVFHNAKFDMAMLKYHFNFTFPRIEDTMALHYTLDESVGSHGLKTLAIKYTDYGNYDEELDTFKKDYCRQHKLKQADFTYDLIPFEVIYKYACMDTITTYALYKKFSEILLKDPEKRLYNMYRKILIKGIEFLAQVEENGVPFDVEALESLSTKLSKEIHEKEQAIYSLPEVKEIEQEYNITFNPGSVAHLRKLLFEKLGLNPIKYTEETQLPSTDAETLAHLAESNDIAKSILELRKAKKIKSTYVDKILLNIDRDSRLRTLFNITKTTSGRLSSSGTLNMQQLPRDDKRVKSCIVARKGYKIISQDLQTAEMYIAAVLSKDKKLQQQFINKKDFHSSIAHTCFNLQCEIDEVKNLFPKLRQASKAISFGILYGSGPAKVADVLGISVAEAKRIIKTYFENFPRLRIWLDECKDHILDYKCIYSIFNRKRRLPNVSSSSNEVVGHEVRSGINFLVQSVASDINLLAAIDMQDWINENELNNNIKIFALVHDSILAEVKDEYVQKYIDKLKYFTQLDRGVSIPYCPINIDVEIGDNYAFGD